MLLRRRRTAGIVGEQQLFPALEQVRHRVQGLLGRLGPGQQLLPAVRHDGAPVAAVAGDEAAAGAEPGDGPAALVGAQAAGHACLPGPHQMLHRVEADEGRTAAVGVAVALNVVLGTQGRAQGAHLAGIGGQGHLPAQILLQGPQHGEVPEGAALDHDAVPQLRHVGDADHLGEDVLDDGAAQARHDVVGLLAVALLVDDGAVHEHRAAAAQHRRIGGAEGSGGDLPHRNAQGGGEVLQEGAAAGGTGLVQHDVGDDAVPQPDGLHVLAADVQQEGGVGHEFPAALGVGHRLHRVVVRLHGLGHHLLAVAGGAHAQDLQPDARLPVFPGQLRQAPLDHQQRFAVVVVVIGVGDALVLVHHHEFGGGAAGVDADVGPQHRTVRNAGGAQQLRTVAALKGLPLRRGGEEGPSPDGTLPVSGGPAQTLRRLRQRHDVRAVLGEQLVDGDGRAPGHDGLRMLRADDVRLPEPQPLRENADEGGVEGQGAALEDDGRRQLQALGQSADGLLGHRVEGGQGDVRPVRPLDQQGLDVRLGEDAAASGDVVDVGAPCRQGLELVRLHVEQGGDLVQKRAGAAGAAAVHPHVGGHKTAQGLVVVEKDHLGVLPAQLHGSAGLGIQRLHGGGVGHHLLYVPGAQRLRRRFAAGAADAHPEGLRGEDGAGLLQQGAGGVQLMGVVALIAGVEHPVGARLQDHQLHRGGAYVNAETQDRGFRVHEKISFRRGSLQPVHTPQSGWDPWELTGLFT